MLTNPANRREQSRREVQWDAECRLGGSFAEGLVCDISRGGVFFTPAGAYRTIAHGDDRSAMAFVEPGDTVLLKYSPRAEADPVMVLATVRWVGRSAEHQAIGAGLEFDRLD
ncbi:MAG: PilZ domain-containing protein [Deltaproteobacteria bacterium]|nr:PilZ domain-containing protein [Deltaproteobacteria bacterium]